MYLIFVDESGYQEDWSQDSAIRQQPFHVVSAVAVPSDNLHEVYTAIRSGVAQLNLPKTDAQALGKGQEIKASQVDRGEGFWGKNQVLRDKVREIYLSLDQHKVTYFAVCIDKKTHKERYSSPENPSNLALRYLLERLQWFLREKDQNGYVIIDQNKRQEPTQRSFLGWLLQFGSGGKALSRLYGTLYEWKLEMSNIVEIHFGDSKYSLGLQIADFVARHVYSWRKKGKDPDYPGWRFIEPRLYGYPEYEGRGYKEFPSGTQVAPW